MRFRPAPIAVGVALAAVLTVAAVLPAVVGDSGPGAERPSGRARPAAADTAPAATPSHAAPLVVAGPRGRRALRGPWILREGDGDPRVLARGRFPGRRVRVPHVPNARAVTGAAGRRAYAGAVAWYRTDVTLREGGDHAIRFESVNHEARVWVDGRPVAAHTGTYLPFEARLSLAPGRHRIVVRADWRDPAAMKATGWHRTWFNFGGINREVTIRRLGPAELDAPGVVTRRAGGALEATVTVRLRNRSGPRALRVRGTLGAAALDFAPVRLGTGRSAWVTARVRMPLAAAWSPERPTLQRLALAVAGSPGHVARVGLRELGWRRGRLTLGGEPLRLRGASLHEDARGRGDALTAADMDRIVARLRRIGANATRSQHALHPALLERLDAAGILVWQGVGPVDQPGRWTSRTPARMRVAVRRVRRSVLQTRAHPSVVAWTLQNEVKGNGHPLGQRVYVERAAREVHRLDPGRPVALDVWGTHLPRRPGRMYRDVDAIGVTNYEGWYANLGAGGRVIDRALRAWLRRVHATFPGRPIVVTEFGAEGNRRNAPGAPGSAELQAALLARHLRAYEADARLDGSLVWALQDFALRPTFAGGSVRRHAPGIRLRRGINEKGVFTYGGRPKPAARVVARAFRSP